MSDEPLDDDDLMTAEEIAEIFNSDEPESE
jgi:hypothetical protein